MSQAFFLRPIKSNTIITITSGKNKAQGDVAACGIWMLFFRFVRCMYVNDLSGTVDIGRATSCGGRASAYIVKRSSEPRNPVSMLFQSCALNQISWPILGEAMRGRVVFAIRSPSRNRLTAPWSLRSCVIVISCGPIFKPGSLHSDYSQIN